ncbi:hypothetical protein [Luteibacter aegosomatissinici]|uniref:hypothetical protein n=1 Tax=Luteibacter aegosomatissinici TaxID=2911539 RepID=UPI001FFA117C|nr:hypothetical protein [Luteibacter aegosomatissinici]UPG93917.1 hypothetical protein L2Y97_19090 [Luteibacter aegosomatissinici]
MKTRPLTAMLALFLAVPMAANATPPEVPTLSAALTQALTEAGSQPGSQASRCERSFREYLADTSRAVDPLLAKAHGSFAVLWSVAEDGRISGAWIVRQTPSGRWLVSLRSDDPPEDTELNAADARRFTAAWKRVMTGKITEVRDVADGSCTLTYDGRHARLFRPGYGIASRADDALQVALTVLDDAWR